MTGRTGRLGRQLIAEGLLERDTTGSAEVPSPIADWQENDHEGTVIMEERPNPNSSENRIAEVLGLAALAIAALVTVIYLLGI